MRNSWVVGLVEPVEWVGAPVRKFDEINTSDRTRTPEAYITSHHNTSHTDTKETQRKHKGNTKLHKITQKLHKRI